MVKAVSEVSDGHGLPENINISAPVYYSGAEAISFAHSGFSPENFSPYPNLELKNSSNPIKDGALEENIVVSRDAHLKKIKLMRDVFSYSQKGFFQKILSFFSLAYDYEDDGTDEILANLLYKMQNKSLEVKQALIKEFYSNTRENIDIPKTEKIIKRFSWINKISTSLAKHFTKAFSTERSFKRKLALAVVNNGQEKELLIDGALNDIEHGHKNLKDLICKYLPDGMSEEQVREVFEAVGEFADSQAIDIMQELKNGNFREKFIELVRKKAGKIIQEARIRTREYIKAFLETAKGRTVKRVVNHAYQKVLHAKKEVEQCKEQTNKALAEVKVKKAESEKALQKAKEEEHKAKNIAESHGCKNLEGDMLYKFVKQKSPTQAYDLMTAQTNKEKARWAEYDARSAEKYAELLEHIANRHFEFEQLRMEATFAHMEALLKMPTG